ncbi:MAG TPA: thiamine diphosphokinase [Bacteroidota bacterium]|nr:thiamine diphosphokinase [Bacteroidota bacterium]
MRALIIGNGALPGRNIIRPLVSSADVIVCGDGGANHARKLRITPDIILGDLDSITASTRRVFRRIPVLLIDDQYSTDLEKAITYCVQRRITSADIIGALGDRIDHTTGSLGCFKKFRKMIQLRMFDGHGVVTLIDGSMKLRTKQGEKLSLIPLERCNGVSTRNLLYGLKNSVLELGVHEGISNEATGSTATIRVKTGTLLLYKFY